MDNKLNRKSKDSVFVKLFSEKENILQLYKELYPEESDAAIGDIDIETIQSIMVNTQYNDLGFTVKNRCIILVEAQTKWSWNFLIRFLMYITETIKRYIRKTKQSVHQTAKLKIPVPELYVIYPGAEDKPSEISLNDEFFGGKSSIDVRVKVINKINRTLAGQYIGFCRVFDEQRKLYRDDSINAAKETYRICIEKDYLAAFMMSHEAEVISIMEELFDEEFAREQYSIAEKRISFEEGEAMGIAKGEAMGIIKGRAEGELQGLKKALDKMISNGINEEQARSILGL